MRFVKITLMFLNLMATFVNLMFALFVWMYLTDKLQQAPTSLNWPFIGWMLAVNAVIAFFTTNSMVHNDAYIRQATKQIKEKSKS